MGVEEYQKIFSDAIETEIQAALAKLSYDKTLIGSIDKIIDLSTGEYKVRYLNDVFSAYDLNLNNNYSVGQEVYIQIPQNNMNEKKIILGRKKTNESELIEVSDSLKRINLVDIPLNNIYNVNMPDNFIGYGSLQSNKDFDTITISNAYDSAFQQYAKNRKLLVISANFTTDWYIPDSVIKGDYGIEVVFETLNGSNLICSLSKENMIGNYYNYNNFTNYAILEIDGANLKGLRKINFYAEDFKRYYEQELTESQMAARFSAGEWEIKVDNINIQFAELNERWNEGLSAYISPIDGIAFNGEKDELRVQSIVKYNGEENQLDKSKIKYYWYQKDISVNINNINYDDIGGVGWKLISNDDKLLVIKDTDFSNYNILKQTYKLVVVYDNKQKASYSIDIYWSFGDFERYYLELFRNSDGQTGILSVQPQENLNNYSALWQSIDSNGIIEILEPKEDNSLEVVIDIANINVKKTFECNLIFNNNIVYTLSLDIYKEIEEAEFELIWKIDNNGIFYYNENGDYIFNNLVKNIDFDVISDTIDVSNLDYEIDFSQDRMFTVNDLTDIVKPFSITLNRRFDRAKSEDNYIYLTLIINGKEYKFNKLLQFVKEGDPGTNGTSLIMDIQYKNNITAALGTGAASSITYDIQLYYDGLPYFNGKNVNDYFTFTASVPSDYEYLNPFANKTIGITRSDTSFTLNFPTFNYNINTPNSIIQIEAKSINQDLFPYNVKYLLAIPQAKSTAQRTYQYIGPTLVMYDKDGYNPRYDDTLPTINNQSVAVLQDVLVKDDGRLAFPNYYDPNNHAMAVYIDGYIQPIVGALNAFSTAILNSWDGSSLIVDNEGSYVLAAQMGAGYKESDNSFTGILMGILNTESSILDAGTGLLGFNKGEGTFGFYTDGRAYIGRSGKGRIEFDTTGDNAIIKSPDANGMTIDLTEGKITANNFYLKSNALTIDSANNRFNFDIANATENGYFRVTNGTTNMINFTNNSQYIRSSNYSTTNKTGMHINLSTGAISTGSGNFSVTAAGNLTANNATLNNVTANSGTFSGTIYADDGEFKGDITGASGTFSGKLESTSGEIGGWNINSSGLYKGNAYLYSDGSMEMGKITVSSNGTVTTNSLIANDLILGDSTGSTTRTASMQMRSTTSGLIPNMAALSLQTPAMAIHANLGSIYLLCGISATHNTRSALQLYPDYSNTYKVGTPTQSTGTKTYNMRTLGTLLVQGNLYVTGDTNIGGGVAVFG